MASPLLFLSYIYVLLCHPWFLCLGGILNILAWESLCFILFMFLSKEWWPDMLSRRLVILYKRWLMLILVMISVVLTVLFVFDTQYKYIYRQWLYYVYIYYNWYVASIDFICTSCTGWIKSAGSTFEFSGFGILDVRK